MNLKVLKIVFILSIIVLNASVSANEYKFINEFVDLQNPPTSFVKIGETIVVSATSESLKNKTLYSIKPVLFAYDNTPKPGSSPNVLKPVNIEYEFIEIKEKLDSNIIRLQMYTSGTFYYLIGVPGYNRKRIWASSPLHMQYKGKIIQIAVRSDDTYTGYLSELLNTPFVMSPYLVYGRHHQVDERMGSDCASFAAYGMRRMGYSVNYSGPNGIKKYLKYISRSVKKNEFNGYNCYFDKDDKPINLIKYKISKGDIIHFEEQVSVFYEDKGLIGYLDENDLLIQSWGVTPYITTIKDCSFDGRIFTIYKWDLSLVKSNATKSCGDTGR